MDPGNESEGRESRQRERLTAELTRPETACGAQFLNAFAAARAEHPRLSIEAAAFAEHLATLVDVGAPDFEHALGELNLADLFLAFGCARAEPMALATFDDRYLRPLRTFVDQIDSSAARLDELKQLLRERLLVSSTSAPPRVAAYRGHGALGAWVQIAARRLALSSLRQRQATALPEEDALQDPLAAGPDPELGYLRVRYAEEFRAAFQAALKELSSHERLLLRLHLIDGLSLTRIAAAYQVSQSTISRRLEQARESMGTRMKNELQAQLGVTDAEFESIVRLAQSRFEFSLSQALQSELVQPPIEP